MKSYLWSIFVVAVVTTSPFKIFSQEREPDLTQRGEEWQGSARKLGEPKQRFPGIHFDEMLFDAIDDITLLGFDFEDVNFKLQTKRRVFENNDIENSRTVADRFRFRIKIPFLDTVSGPLSFYAGGEAGLDVMDIRQMRPSTPTPIESLSNRKAEIENDSSFKNISKTPGLFSGLLNTSDPETQAKLGDLPNLILQAFKIPLSLESYGKLENGEVISYNASGSLEFGAGPQWDVSVIGWDGAVGLNVTFYVKKEWRISVLKESDRFAKVKVAHLRSAIGKDTTIGATDDASLLDGIAVLSLFRHQTKIIPFKLKMKDEAGVTNDMGYRYDLSSPVGQEAYMNAIRGRFKMSEEISQREGGAVTHAFERGAVYTRGEVSRQLKIAFIFNNKLKSTRDNIEARITLPDGTSSVFSSLVENSKEWKTIWGAYEKLSYRFGVAVDVDRYEKDRDDVGAYTLSCEGSIADSDTNRGELINYINEAENAVGKHGLFPRPDTKMNNYGRSRIYYRVDFHRKQIQKFLKTPLSERWAMLEAAFGMRPGSWQDPGRRTMDGIFSGGGFIVTSPLFLAGFPIKQTERVFNAQAIFDRWKKASQMKYIDDQVNEMGRLFFKPDFSYELLMLMRKALNGEKIKYTVNAYNPTFGLIVDHGESTLSFQNVSTKTNWEIDYDKEGARTPPEPENSKVLSLMVNRSSPTSLMIQFGIEVEPKALLFMVENLGQRSKDNEGQVLIMNNGNFKVGSNSIELQLNDSASPYWPILQRLETGNRYRLKVAANTTGDQVWGSVVSAEFDMKD